ncbi:heterogeneous nuclear ribonucleoprotein A0-like [Entelurus aequoreus]|uniref:heterogeneous nuclear ribonucleoprotein A0-like n=1 Tax=Entelurus aequoreus TaxID=161455 RepID=UPI002B1E7D34|nr:heterogeneous nuclear ribonucleoprotein A0-like [Entelurus aequoreus]
MNFLKSSLGAEAIGKLAGDKVEDIVEDAMNKVMGGGGGKGEQDQNDNNGLDLGSLVGGNGNDNKGGLGNVMSLMGGGKDESGGGGGIGNVVGKLFD